MHIDASDLDDDTNIDADLCIVGAGAAGISMALEWVGMSHKVLLLEAGGFDYDTQSQDSYRANNVGEPYFPLHAARLRYFGGTTGHWAGFCAPLDPIDFENRDWVPGGNWPISLQDLDPYYQRTQKLVELGPYNYSADYWEEQNPAIRRLSLGNTFWTKIWQFSPPTRFGIKYRAAIVDSPNVHLYTNATACELVANPGVSSLQHLRVRTSQGREHRVQARRYVLACGALQNARLLLASNRQTPGGVGNDQDLVGRYFMEHIEIPGANLLLSNPQALEMYTARPRVAGTATSARGELALNAEVQRKERVLNGTASIASGSWGENIKSTFQQFTPSELDKFRTSRDRAQTDTPKVSRQKIAASSEFRLKTRQEQAPNPNSRVFLDDEKDAYGMRRLNIDWQLTDLDKHSIRRFYQLLGREMGRNGIGRIQLADWLLDSDDSEWPSFLSGGWHHMGTTRMHESSQKGVVDPDCKVHGIDNLWIAGSGPFPTSGAPNPTLTLIALTLRLSDHLKQAID